MNALENFTIEGCGINYLIVSHIWWWWSSKVRQCQLQLQLISSYLSIFKNEWEKYKGYWWKFAIDIENLEREIILRVEILEKELEDEIKEKTQQDPHSEDCLDRFISMNRFCASFMLSPCSAWLEV